MTASGPRLSVIVPTLDEEAAIADLLGDLAALRAAGHEVILVDGGSRDATLQVAAPLVDRAVQAPRGRASQMNAGAAVACGAVLWFLHADTRVPAGAAAQLLQTCGTGDGWGFFQVRLSGRRWPLRVIEKMMNLRSRFTRIATGDQGLFVGRTLFDLAGGFPQIPLMEDVALSGELRRLARPCCVRHPILGTSSRRWEAHGILRTVVLMWRLRLAYALGTPPSELAERYW